MNHNIQREPSLANQTLDWVFTFTVSCLMLMFLALCGSFVTRTIIDMWAFKP